MNVIEIIQDQRTNDAYFEAIDIIMKKLPRTEEQIKQIGDYVKEHDKELVTEYAQMVHEAMKNDTPLAFYDIWTIGKADEALFG